MYWFSGKLATIDHMAAGLSGLLRLRALGWRALMTPPPPPPPPEMADIPLFFLSETI